MRILAQKLNDLLGVLHMAVNTQRKRLGTLKQQECIERRDAGALVAQQNSANVGCKRSSAHSIDKRDAMVGGVGIGELRILARSLPVKVAAVDDHAAKRGAVTTDELCRGVNDDVGTVLQRTEQVRGAKGIVHNDRQAVLVGNLGDCVDVGDIGVGVAQRLQIDNGGVVLNCALDLFEIMSIDKGRLNTKLRKRMLKQIVRTTVDGLLSNHMVTGLRKRLDGIGNGSSTRRDGKARHAALERGDTILKDALSRIGQAPVNVAGIGQAKAIGSMLGVAEDIARGLINGHSASIGCGIGAFLANMQLKGIEAKGMLGVVDKLGHDVLLKQGRRKSAGKSGR